MRSTAVCSGWPTRSSCSPRATSRSRPRSARECWSAAASSTRRRKGRHRRERTLMGDALANFVYVFLWVYLLLLFAYILTSWVRLPYRPWLNRVQRFLYDVCDPYLRIFRRFIPPAGPLDLSPMVAIFVLLIVQNVLVSLLQRL